MNVSSASSFYEPPVKYDKGKTQDLYQKLKANFQEVQQALNNTERDLLKLKKNADKTETLITKMSEVKAASKENQNKE